MVLKLLAQHNNWNRGVEVAIGSFNSAGDLSGVVQPFVIKAAEPNQLVSPLIVGPLAQEFLQSALNAAWEMGMRPTNWRLETTEQVAAMDNHLQDMRRLVFEHPRVFVTPPGPETRSNVG